MIFKGLFGRKDKNAGDVDIGGTKDLLTVGRTLAASPERAFTVFVDEIDRWWPRERTWAKGNLAAMVVEPRYKGRCFERSKDGAIAVWGTVLAFDRPQHIVFSWQIGPDGRPTENEGASSRVDVRFAAGEPGGTMQSPHRSPRLLPPRRGMGEIPRGDGRPERLADAGRGLCEGPRRLIVRRLRTDDLANRENRRFRVSFPHGPEPFGLGRG